MISTPKRARSTALISRIAAYGTSASLAGLPNIPQPVPVCVGTRLVAREESAAHREYKIRLLASEVEDTVITAVFGPE